MEQIIIDALIKKLYELFPDIKAYDQKMDMEVEPPMFVISCYDRVRRDRITPGGFFYTYYFNILFFSGHDEPEEAYRDIELDLTDGIWSFDRFRSDDIRASATDGVLRVDFSVTVELKRVREFPKIEEIKQESKANGKEISTQTIS